MSHEQSYNRRNGGPAWIRNGLEIILLFLIVSVIFILAYQILVHEGRSHAVKFDQVLTSGERTKLLLKNR